ncbi:transglutaminase-like domain-containing protein [Roseibium sp.]|uniref:transglutaminase-like domain-containing protein n=1 Tax=Roseibium sp. TaxID=1936156 RepID=UPI003A969288
MLTRVLVTVEPHPDVDARLLAPIGLPTPHQMPLEFAVQGGLVTLSGEVTTGQMAAVIAPDDSGPLMLRYEYLDLGTAYPEALFTPRRNKFTRAAEDLVEDARRIATTAPDGHAAIQALVNAAAEKFRYAHPQVRFNDRCEEVPYLSCGLTEGSCVDINTYLIASLRAAGFEAGYVYGYFFPSEKNGACDDGHCWVVTRHEGVVLEWDIAHHLKLGTRDVCCGLNPKAGHRVAAAHSMGLSFPSLGIQETKLIGEPMWISEGQLLPAKLSIRCERGSAVEAA